MAIHRRKISPYLVIVVGFFALILLGFGLLMLPVSVKEGVSLKAVDAFFLSASSVCITGLSPVNLIETFTGFGQAVIAVLVQVGGLGFVTIAMTVIAMMNIRLGMTNRMLINETLGSSGRLDYRRFLLRAVAMTAVCEILGFIFNIIALRHDYSGGMLVWVSLFHSISAFNNAGLDLFGGGMLRFSNNVFLLLNTSWLTIVGGLGFIVLNELLTVRRWKKFSVHTKIVLTMTPTLLIGGTLLIYLSEWGKIDFLNAFFMSTMARTCGFSTQDLTQWNTASLCFLNVLMFIGAGPASTGGGVKITTFFVFTAVILALVRGKPTSAFHRRIRPDSVIHALLLGAVGLTLTFLIGTSLCALHPEIRLDFLFTETISALANVGFSANVTASLSTAAKLILSFAMFTGRIGFMTLLLVFKRRWNRRENTGVRLVEADVIIG